MVKARAREAGAMPSDIETQQDDATGGATLEELYREHYRPLVRLVYAIVGNLDLAEDLAQEAFVRTSSRLTRLREPSAAKAYLRTAAVNLARRSLRRRFLDIRVRLRLIEVPDHPEHEDRLVVREALYSLPTGQRACLVLRYYEGLTEQQTAEMLGVAVGTVKSQTHK
ncbi:MAG: SigE family RNA polymerase sigma factor, partial [Candidatus Binatia bacterium]